MPSPCYWHVLTTLPGVAPLRRDLRRTRANLQVHCDDDAALQLYDHARTQLADAIARHAYHLGRLAASRPG